ncbi:MAG: PAS domain S-box protein, partial [Ferruginibacter sp.]
KQRGFTEEFLFYRKDQSTFWGRLNRQFVFDVNGRVIQKFSILEDISQQKEAEQKLKDSERMFRATLQKIGDNVWEHDFTTGETIFSKEENDLLGYSTSDYKKNDQLWWSSIYPPDIPLLKANDKLTRKGEIDHHTLEYRLKHKDGSVKWVLDRGVVIAKDEAGKPLKMIGTHTDITRIKQTELELEQRVKQFSSLSENIPGVIVEYEYRKDGTEGYRYISSAIEKIIGISQEDFLHHYTFIHPDDQKQNAEKNRHSRDTLEPFYNESRLIVPGKGTIWCSVTASFSYWSETDSKVFTGFILNITQKKMAEELLKKEEDKYRSIIANMNLGLLEVNLDEKIIFANHSFCEMSGYNRDELIGKVAAKLFVRGDNTELIEQKNELRKKGASDAYEIVIKNKQGDMKWWLISGAPRYDDDGTLIGSIGIHLDITEQKKLELELIDAREQAEASSKSKEAFLANMSHEIRTPMNAIMGMSNQLSKTTLNDQQRFFLENISAASENLMIIINDILDLSKIEAGKLSLENIGFEPKTVISRAMQVLTHRAEEKGLLISNSSCDYKLSPVLIGDPYRLNQVLLNLMSNSIKFTEKGYVDLSCTVIEDAARYQTVAITVKDTGIGMDEEYVKNIFEKFTQEDSSVTRKYGGTGLGMSISKDLVQLMGGTIQVESKKGVGTSITFQIKFIKGTGADLPSKDSYTLDSSVLKGKRILVVDDNDLNRLVACTILKHYAIETFEATNGKDAIELLKMETIDLVLMDIQMPVMDGIEATRIIRKSFSVTLPLVALTANALKGDNEKYLEAGMNDYLSKPFKEEELLRIVSIWLGKGKAIVAQPKFDQPIDENKLYDLSKLKEISKGNAAFVNKMIALFLEQIPSTVAEIKEGFVQDDFDRIYALAHRIKPTIDNLNIHSLKTEIRSIEEFAKNKVGGQQLQGLIDKLERVILEVKDIIIKEIE